MDDDCQGLNDTELIQKASNKFVMTYCYTHQFINNLGNLYKKRQNDIVLSMTQKFKTRYPEATKEEIKIFTDKLYHDAMDKAIQFQIRLSEDEIENIPEDGYIINPNNNSSNNNIPNDLNQQNDHDNSINNNQQQNDHNHTLNDQSAMYLNQQQNNHTTNNNLHKHHHFDDFQMEENNHISNKDNIINDSRNLLTNVDDDDETEVISIGDDDSRESTPYVPTEIDDNNSIKRLQRKRKQKYMT